MSSAVGLGISTAGALVLLLGLLVKSTAKLRRELESYASGYNADLARDRLEARYDPVRW